jgi:tellurite methyltransferase
MDKKYWEEYYQKQRSELLPTLFAQYVMKNYIINNKSNLIELGCGNGRDSVYFADQGLNILAIDQVELEIKFLQHRFPEKNNLSFSCDDFSDLGKESTYDIVYSRFTLHSINVFQQKRVLNWAYQQLSESGVLCVEVRGKHNELYEKGEPVAQEKDAYIFDNHYRRFIDFDSFCTELKEIGFTIDYSEEAKGFAPFKDTNETFIRVIAKK